jgi:hypothetical protein
MLCGYREHSCHVTMKQLHVPIAMVVVEASNCIIATVASPSELHRCFIPLSADNMASIGQRNACRHAATPTEDITNPDAPAELHLLVLFWVGEGYVVMFRRVAERDNLLYIVEVVLVGVYVCPDPALPFSVLLPPLCRTLARASLWHWHVHHYRPTSGAKHARWLLLVQR